MSNRKRHVTTALLTAALLSSGPAWPIDSDILGDPVREKTEGISYIESIETKITENEVFVGKTLYKNESGNCHLVTRELVEMKKSAGVDLPIINQSTRPVSCDTPL
ncbi:hypothetical protein AWH63_11050 [Marinobacter sp. C18]|uniref:hypothetical protein n=1 Tax=Marinobacter sp. C18 TaxID=1772288 RepID=UPI000948CDB6|nr:hypothetical protein [Marinobacter sp. C18]OLF82069.1 hypothetical protein AWH63_11050 [Marinobacter sp. C18]